jgi:hypothetical protein
MVLRLTDWINNIGLRSLLSVQGAWSFWYLPGSPSFHVKWTGVAETVGGMGCILAGLELPFLPEWLLPASAFGLFLLTVAVTPANVCLWTHRVSPLRRKSRIRLVISPGNFTHLIV